MIGLKKLLLFAIFCISVCCYTQTYIPLPDSNARWVNTHSLNDVSTGIPQWQVQSTQRYCTNGEDTLINSINYSKLFNCPVLYKGCFRNDNGKVFYVPKDSTQEFLWYDYSAQNGDTLYNVYIEDYTGYCGLIDIYLGPSAEDVWLTHGVFRKTINTPYGATWIEGIGSRSGLFGINSQGQNKYELICFSHNDTIYFPIDVLGNCQLDLSINPIQKQEIKTHPNPSSNGWITVESNNLLGNTSYQYYSITGQQVLEGQFESNTIPTPVKAGVYVLIIGNESHFYHQKVVVE